MPVLNLAYDLVDDAVATSREDQRSPKSDRADRRPRLGRGPVREDQYR